MPGQIQVVPGQKGERQWVRGSTAIMSGVRDRRDGRAFATASTKTVVPPGSIPRAVNFALGGMAG